MNRKIKFRKWAKHTDGSMAIVDDVILGGATLNSLREEDNDVLMQYTGLKDKNGKEIYEGGILETPFIFRKFLASKWVVVAIGGEYAVKIKGGREYRNLPYFLETELSVVRVGNIYENPELISGGLVDTTH